MGKTYRNWATSESDKRNSRSAKKHSKMKQKENGVKRMKLKQDFDNYGETEG